ncbi:hypothetical protein DL768_001280 [Monosporascus sp. mg162]|nr:hypothetical protein DL768_001280 [Monosporascus sp. mg162]
MLQGVERLADNYVIGASTAANPKPEQFIACSERLERSESPGCKSPRFTAQGPTHKRNAAMHDRGLEVLVPLPSDGPGGHAPLAVDIVMVHGLNGNRTTTWTQNGCLWPRDLLPEKISTARVLTFGYNADLAWNYSTYGIRDHATMLLTSLRDKRDEPDELDRPLIFVCHSLGGIIVKKVANKDSATMKITQEEAIPIEGHHRDIRRFYGAQDERFEAVWKAIRRLIPREEIRSLTAEQVNFLNSLPGPNVYEALETVEEPCLGTTDWVLSNPQFTAWLISVESHVLHVVGKPGSGKSALAAFLFRSGIRQVLNHHPFYFAFTDRSDGRSAAAAWAALVYQLLLEDPSLFSKVFTQSRRIYPCLDAKLWTESRLKQIFERLLELRHPSVYIIDALDQCDETMENFPKLMSFDLDDQIQHDVGIRTAIKQKVAELCRKRDCPQLADTITEKLSPTAKGMYLLPMMAVSSLMKVHATPRNIMKELHRFPEDLMIAYRQALDKVKEDDRQLAASLLLLVVFTTRSLSIRELSSVVALDDTVETGWDLKMNTSVDLLGTAGVVELLGPILKVSKSEGNSFVSLIHHSTREFLLRFDRTADNPNFDPSDPEDQWSEQEDPDRGSRTRTRTPMATMPTLIGVPPEPLTLQYPSPCSSISPERWRSWHQSHEAMAYKFTLPSELARDQDKDSEARILLGDDVFEEFPALRYCIENLPEHVRLVESSNIPFHKSFAAFLHSKLGANWIDSFWAIRDPEQAYGRQPAAHFASALGLEPEIKSLLASGISVDDRDQYGNTALDVATSTGIVDTIRLLYEIGQADIHARQMASFDPQDPIFQRYNNVLHTAVWYGHKDATVYLLGAGAKMLVPDLKGLTALDIAVNSGNSPFVKLLVDKPSTLDVVHFAAKRGRLETLKWLIERENVDPCIKGWQGDTHFMSRLSTIKLPASNT